MADYYELLGVARDAPADEIRRAYLRLARERHPDRFPAGPERDRAHEQFQEATAAFNTLLNERSRRQYDGELARPAAAGPEEIARASCERGYESLERRQYHEAVELFRAALALAPNVARAHAGLSLALAQNPHWVHDAVKEAEEAIRLEPRAAAWHGQLAELLLAQGLKLRARRAAEAALALDPAEPRALRVAQAAGAAPSPSRRRPAVFSAACGADDGPGTPCPCPAFGVYWRLVAMKGPERSVESAMKVSYQAVTDVGRKRKGNEDSLFVNPEQQLFVVADGMGGHAAGEVASRIAVDAINEFVCLTSGDQDITWPFGLDETISYDGNRLKTAIRWANRKVLEATREKAEYEGMATTVAAVLLDGETANLAHVGDSRVYLFRDGQLRQLTMDHSWINEQVQSGVITLDQARSHPLRNVVTRALGGKADCQVDMQVHLGRGGDVLLLCSDGLTSMTPDDEIARIVRDSDGDLAGTAQALVDAANARGGEDNITVLLLKFEED